MESNADDLIMVNYSVKSSTIAFPMALSTRGCPYDLQKLAAAG
jgi:hypothetical protein